MALSRRTLVVIASNTFAENDEKLQSQTWKRMHSDQDANYLGLKQVEQTKYSIDMVYGEGHFKSNWKQFSFNHSLPTVPQSGQLGSKNRPKPPRHFLLNALILNKHIQLSKCKYSLVRNFTYSNEKSSIVKIWKLSWLKNLHRIGSSTDIPLSSRLDQACMLPQGPYTTERSK